MHIMTKDGWKALGPAVFTPAPKAIASNGVPAPYDGKFPSQAICNLHNDMQEHMRFFDSGVRMAYGKADRIVDVDNAIAANPIKYPPKDF